MIKLAVSCLLLAVMATAVPVFPTDFHAVVNTTSEGVLSPYPKFNEVYQDATNNRALLIHDKIASLLVVAPEGASPETKEAKEMTYFEIHSGDSDYCSYQADEWPCKGNNTICTTIFSYPDYSRVGPWQIPCKIPNRYVGKETIEINGERIAAEKWEERVPNVNSSDPDILTYWVREIDQSTPLRFNHTHPHQKNYFEDRWSYQIDFIKFEHGQFPDHVYAPPEDWVDKCDDLNAGLKSENLSIQDDGSLLLLSRPHKIGMFSLSLHTRPVSKLPVTVNITSCNITDSGQNCNPDENCETCVKVSPTLLKFTQEDWNVPQKVMAVFDHVGMKQFNYVVSENYKLHNPAEDLQFAVYCCDPQHEVPCKPL